MINYGTILDNSWWWLAVTVDQTGVDKMEADKMGTYPRDVEYLSKNASEIAVKRLKTIKLSNYKEQVTRIKDLQ